MSGALLILAIIGFLGAARLAARAAFRFLFRGVESFLAGQVRETHARRGDITALQTADVTRRAVRRARRISLAALMGWVCLLAVPPFTPWAQAIYAAYVPLWLYPPRRRA